MFGPRRTLGLYHFGKVPSEWTTPNGILMNRESSVEAAKALADATVLKIGHVCTPVCQDWEEISSV